MLTRRTFLTTIAAAPLAKFCKTEPLRPYNISRLAGTVTFSQDIWKAMDEAMDIHGRQVGLNDLLYGLKPGTLG